MLTRKRLEEAKYFYNNLVGTKNDDEFHFNLSAFLNAWRSILDVMLYDLNEQYSLGFSREEELGSKELAAVANALKNAQAIQFIEWRKRMQGVLSSNPLWRKRNITFHRGYPPVSEYRIYVSGSGDTSITVSGVAGYLKPISWPTLGSIPQTDPTNYYFSDMQDRSILESRDNRY